MLNVKRIKYDEHFTSGCETCDWGSSYLNELDIILEDETYTNIKIDKMYDYVLSESDVMQLVANSNDIEDFYIKLIEHIKNNQWDGNIGFVIQLQGLFIEIDGKPVDILQTLKQKKLIFMEFEE